MASERKQRGINQLSASYLSQREFVNFNEELLTQFVSLFNLLRCRSPRHDADRAE
jgi:hypothetical protein